MRFNVALPPIQGSVSASHVLAGLPMIGVSVHKAFKERPVSKIVRIHQIVGPEVMSLRRASCGSK
jgi:hypothetical protein